MHRARTARKLIPESSIQLLDRFQARLHAGYCIEGSRVLFYLQQASEISLVALMQQSISCLCTRMAAWQHLLDVSLLVSPQLDPQGQPGMFAWW